MHSPLLSLLDAAPVPSHCRIWTGLLLGCLTFLLAGCGGSRPKPPPPGDPSLPEIDVLQLKENSEEALRLSQENRLELQSLHAKMKEIESRLGQIGESLSGLPLYRLDTLAGGLVGLQSQIDALHQRISRIPNAPPPPRLPATFSPNPDGAAALKASGKESASAPADSSTPTPKEPGSTASHGAKAKGKKPSPSEAQAYKKAFDLYYGGDYKNARKRFQEILDLHPKGAYADNSQYWAGECDFALGQFQNALKSFELVFTYEGTEKADDAQLKIGYAYLRLGDKKLAAETFRKLLSLYPDSEYSERAKDELGKLE